MAQKVILDVDPGIDDAVALTMALFDPRLDVLAVTAVGGNVPAPQATRNVQAIIEQLDPPRWPRIGAAAEPEHVVPADSRHLFGVDGLANTNFQVAELHNQHASEKVIHDELRANPGEVTIIALGPLTNIARVFQRDPEIVHLVGELIIMGGAVCEPGNVTAAAEFNMYCDPVSAQTVFRSATTKTLVPLDVTNRALIGFDLLDRLPAESTAAGQFMRKVLPFAFRTHRQVLGIEGLYLHDAVVLCAATDPDLFETEMMPGDVETIGQLTAGATVFDRRPASGATANIAVATQIDVTGVIERIVAGLKRAGECTAR